MKKVILTIPIWAWIMTGVAVFVNVVYIMSAYKTPIIGIGVTLDNNNTYVVSKVLTDSPADLAGITNGDKLLLIDGQEIAPGTYFRIIHLNYNPGQIIKFTMSRHGREFETNMLITSFIWQYTFVLFVLYTILTLIILLGLYLLYKKPHERTVQIFALYMFLLVLSFNTRYLLVKDPISIIATSLFTFGFTLFGPCLIYFHLLFPFNAGVQKAQYVIKGSFIIGGGLALLMIVELIHEIYYGPGTYFYNVLKLAVNWMAISLVAALGIAVVRYYRCKNNQIKKQLKLLIIGSAIGIATPIIFGFYPEFFWRLEDEQHMRTFLMTFTSIGSSLMIALFLFAIFKYRIWDIEPLVKKVLLYVAATIIVTGIYTLLIHFVNRAFLDMNEGHHLLVLAVAVLVFMLIRDYIQQQVERLFYRKKTDSTSILSSFEHHLSGKYIEEEIMHSTSSFITTVFPVKSVVYYTKRNHNHYAPYGTELSGEENIVEISDNLHNKIQKGELIMVEDILKVPEFITGASIIVPITDKQVNYGLFLLGPRLDERSWKLNDMYILSVVSCRVASLLLTADLYRKDLNHQLFLERERSRLNAGLSIRETEILSLLARGYMYKEIADMLFISVETVRTHLRNIYTKLEVRTRTEAVVKFLEK